MCVAEVGFPIERAVGESLRGFRKQRDFFYLFCFLIHHMEAESGGAHL